MFTYFVIATGAGCHSRVCFTAVFPEVALLVEVEVACLKGKILEPQIKFLWAHTCTKLSQTQLPSRQMH